MWTLGWDRGWVGGWGAFGKVLLATRGGRGKDGSEGRLRGRPAGWVAEVEVGGWRDAAALTVRRADWKERLPLPPPPPPSGTSIFSLFSSYPSLRFFLLSRLNPSIASSSITTSPTKPPCLFSFHLFSTEIRQP
ncbi:hypothetical protein Q8A73_002918 [Channa argus]|nr:hypothetical protein Q8A73_002918 [Channa argus]